MESGSANILMSFTVSRRDVVLDMFIANTTAPGSTFMCMCNATASLQSREAVASVFPEPFLFISVIDGPYSPLPDLPSKLLAVGQFSKILFMAGTVLDEGTCLVSTQISSDGKLKGFIAVADNLFAPSLMLQYQQDAGTLLVLYPDSLVHRSRWGKRPLG